MESKITTNFDAKMEQKMGYPPDFGGLSRPLKNSLDPKPILYVPELQNLNFVYA